MSPEWFQFAFGLMATGVSVGVSYGVLSARVTGLRREIERKIERAEYDAAMKRLDELHSDLREIRDLLMEVIRGGKA